MEETEKSLSVTGENTPAPDNNTEKRTLLTIGILFGILIGLLVALAVFFGIKFGKNIIMKKKAGESVATEETLKKIRTIEGVINGNLYRYNDEITTSDMEEGIYRGILEYFGML